MAKIDLNVARKIMGYLTDLLIIGRKAGLWAMGQGVNAPVGGEVHRLGRR